MVALTLQPALIAQQRKGGHLLGRPQWRPRRAAAAQCSCQCRQEQAVAAPRSPAQRLLSGAAALAASAALAFAPLDVATLPAHAQLISNDNPVVDLARVVPESKEHELAERIKALERCDFWLGFPSASFEVGLHRHASLAAHPMQRPAAAPSRACRWLRL